MNHLLSLDGWDRGRAESLFGVADAYATGHGPRREGCAAMFFPASSIRTRVTFERGAGAMGLQPVLFPPESLDKPEAHADVATYLAQWCDVAVVRHPRPETLAALAAPDALPVVNAMTDEDHPCEVLSDLYALSRRGRDPWGLRYVFVGAAGNIGFAWANAARVLGLDLVQTCPAALAMPGVAFEEEPAGALRGADVVLTDPPGPHAEALAPWRITPALLDHAAPDVLLNPCPPFVRGREVAAEVIDDGRWVGHAFKRALLPVQQAVLAWCLGLE